MPNMMMTTATMTTARIPKYIIFFLSWNTELYIFYFSLSCSKNWDRNIWFSQTKNVLEIFYHFINYAKEPEQGILTWENSSENGALINNFRLSSILSSFQNLCQLQIKLENEPFSQTLEFQILVLKCCLPGSFLAFQSLPFNTSVTSLYFAQFS